MPVSSLQTFVDDLDGYEMYEAIKNELLLSKMFITTGAEPDFDAGEILGRLKSVANKSKVRDSAACNVTRSANPDMSHIFPFWATSSKNYVGRTIRIFDNVDKKLDGDF